MSLRLATLFCGTNKIENYMKKILVLLFGLTFTVTLPAQEQPDDGYAYDKSYYKLDILGIRDPTTRTFNGLSLGIFITPEYRETINGILLGGIVATGAKKVNGIAIGGMYTYIDTVNGFVFSPFISKFNQTKGMGFGLMHMSESSQGFYMTVMGGGARDFEGVFISGLLQGSQFFKGLGIAPINATIELSGVQIGVFNYAKNANGVQFGLINYIKGNPRGLRILPFVNFRFHKKE